MSENFKLKEEQFAISDDGIHLLRNNFNYETIQFNQIDSITIKRGKEIKNWLVVLIIGIAVLTYAIFDSIQLYQAIFNDKVDRIYIERILMPLFPFLVGCLFIYISLRTTKVIIINTLKKSHYFSLSTLDKSNLISELIVVLKNKNVSIVEKL